jgi:hypothetical protein
MLGGTLVYVVHGRTRFHVKLPRSEIRERQAAFFNRLLKYPST